MNKKKRISFIAKTKQGNKVKVILPKATKPKKKKEVRENE